MNGTEYKQAMAAIDAGGKVDRATYDAIVEYAARRKARRPRPDAVAAAANKRAINAGRACSAEGCDEAARAKGMCGRHHTAWWRSQDPDRMERAREASRRYAARKRAERDEARAAADKSAVSGE